jgi:integrase
MRRPTLYKHRGTWYVRIWNAAEGKYRAHSLGIPVEGKRERRREAEEAARVLAEKLTEATEQAAKEAEQRIPLADTSLLSYLESFWQDDGEYAREKALVEQTPVSLHYLLTNRQAIKNKAALFDGFQGLTLSMLSKSLIRRWKLWMAEQGHSGRVINVALQAVRVPVRMAFNDDVIPLDPFAGVKRAAHKEKRRGILRPAEIKRLVGSPVLDPYTRLAVYLSLYCSMRMGEVRGLLWGDIADGVIHICHNWQEREGLKGCHTATSPELPCRRLNPSTVNTLFFFLVAYPIRPRHLKRFLVSIMLFTPWPRCQS